MHKLFFFIIIGTIVLSCNTNPNKKVDAGDTPQSEKGVSDKKLVEQIFYNVPSPLEMAKMVRDAGMKFNPELMNPVGNKQYYIDQTSQALNLGVYGADLSYSRIFDQVQKSVNYLSVIRELTEALQIPQDKGVFAIDKLEAHIDNRDSLLHIITDIYGEVDIYLKENNRSMVAVMIIAGGWIEGNYLAVSSIDEKKPNPTIQKRIAEQKLSLQSLIKLIQPHVRKDHKSVQILNSLKKLADIYKNVSIKTTETSVETDHEQGKTVLKGITEVKIDQNTLKEINKSITALRKKITTP